MVRRDLELQFEIGIWNSNLELQFGFGIWNLEFGNGIWNLEFGIGIWNWNSMDQHTYSPIASSVIVELDCVQFDYIH